MSAEDATRANKGWFRKGRSGNPGGRPKGAREPERSPLDIIVERTVSISSNGIGRELGVDEALQLRTYKDALAGKRMAIRQVLHWILKREQWLAKKRQRTVAIISRGMRQDPDNADEALLLLDIARIEPGWESNRREGYRQRLLLEPWAVNAALRRRRGTQKLTRDDCDEIRRCTRMDASVKLPEQFDE